MKTVNAAAFHGGCAALFAAPPGGAFASGAVAEGVRKFVCEALI